jgi:hypothetical protein
MMRVYNLEQYTDCGTLVELEELSEGQDPVVAWDCLAELPADDAGVDPTPEWVDAYEV